MNGRALVVAFHDLAPHSERAARDLLGRLARLGVPRVSLLLVPRWHGVTPIGERPAFRRFVVAAAAAGHEICLHGETHLDDAAPRRNLASRLLGRFYTAGEGELYGIDRDGARAKIDRGLAALAGLGLAPRGFVAPAWLLSPAAREVLCERGFTYTTTLCTLDLLATGTVHAAPTLVWSSRSLWRRAVSRGYARALFAARQNAPVLRIAVHPRDLDHPTLYRDLLCFVRRALDQGRAPLTYGELAQALAGRPETSQTCQPAVTAERSGASENPLSLSPANG